MPISAEAHRCKIGTFHAIFIKILEKKCSRPCKQHKYTPFSQWDYFTDLNCRILVTTFCAMVFLLSVRCCVFLSQSSWISDHAQHLQKVFSSAKLHSCDTCCCIATLPTHRGHRRSSDNLSALEDAVSHLRRCFLMWAVAFRYHQLAAWRLRRRARYVVRLKCSSVAVRCLSVSAVMVFLVRLLLACGDVEANPGPGWPNDLRDQHEEHMDCPPSSHHLYETDHQHGPGNFTHAGVSSAQSLDPSSSAIDVQRRMLYLAGYPRQFDNSTRHSSPYPAVLSLADTVNKLHSWCCSLQQQNDQLKQDTGTLASKCTLLEQECENLHQWKDYFDDVNQKTDSQMDKLESFSRRNNIRFFNVYEEPEEDNDQCVHKVVKLMNRFFPDRKRWTEDDVERAHRTGPKSQDSSRPRPIIACLHRWHDKLFILQSSTNRREMADTLGVRVASDLTHRQNHVLREEKMAGKKAYFWKGRLCYNSNNRSPQQHNLHRYGRRTRTNVRSGDNMTRNDSASADTTQTMAERRLDVTENSGRPPHEDPSHAISRHYHRQQTEEETNQPSGNMNGNPPSIYDMNAFPTLQGQKPRKDNNRNPPPVAHSAPTDNTASWRSEDTHRNQGHAHHVASPAPADHDSDQAQCTVNGTGGDASLSAHHDSDQAQCTVNGTGGDASLSAHHDSDQTQCTVNGTGGDASLSAHLPQIPSLPASPRPQRTPQPRTRKRNDQWGVRLVDEPEDSRDNSTASHVDTDQCHSCQTEAAPDFELPPPVDPSRYRSDHPRSKLGMLSAPPPSAPPCADPAHTGNVVKPNSTPPPQVVHPTSEAEPNCPRDRNGATPVGSPDHAQHATELTPAASPPNDADSSQTFLKQPVEAWPVNKDIESQSPILPQADSRESGKPAEVQPAAVSTEQDCSLINETPTFPSRLTRSRMRSRQAQVTESFPRIGVSASRSSGPLEQSPG